ncbi:MAG: acetylglutamate kinase [Mogibacterium sp.]|nr:acetylglutamate kinase [Mogibacterium sp.]
MTKNAEQKNIMNYMKKAEVLIEALPYIQRFNRKIIVIKYGGSAMLDDELMRHVIEDAVLLKLIGFKPVIVHGGGKEISRWMRRTGIEPQFIDGLRVTDAETLELAEMVLGKVNSDLVTLAQQLGVRACGISGKDGKLLTVRRFQPNGEDIGFVGEVVKVDPKIIQDLLSDDFLPIIYPIGMDDSGQSYNINGDHAAAEIAQALKADKLAYLTDTSGVYIDPDDPDSFIPELRIREAEKMIEAGTISGGMIPKVRNCFHSIRNGVGRVHILNGSIPHCLLLEFFTDRGVGTVILSEEAEKYYRGTADQDKKNG